MQLEITKFYKEKNKKLEIKVEYMWKLLKKSFNYVIIDINTLLSG